MVLRVWNTEIDENLDGVVETVIHYAHQRMGLVLGEQPHPSPLGVGSFAASGASARGRC